MKNKIADFLLTNREFFIEDLNICSIRIADFFIFAAFKLTSYDLA